MMSKKDFLFTWEDFEKLDVSKSFAFLQGSLETMDEQPCNFAIQQKIIKKMDLKLGTQILEVGCGLGRRARRISAASEGRAMITAVDNSDKVLDIARAVSSEKNVTYLKANAENLPFPNNYFDIVTAERLLICFSDALPVLKEMYRVLKPGGQLIITDFDPASVFISPSYGNMQETFLKIYLPSFADPYIGRKLPDMFHQLGMTHFEVEVDTSYERDIAQLMRIIPMKAVLDGGVRAEFLSQHQADIWMQALQDASQKGTFLYGINVVSVLGKKS